MIQKTVKYGNSVAVVLPKELVARMNLEPGTQVSIEEQNGRVEISRVRVVPELSDKDKKFVEELYQKRRKVFEALAE